MNKSHSTATTRPGSQAQAAKPAPRVFILLVSWNGKEDTLACLRSLQKLTDAHPKIVLVDNASSDGTVEAVRRAFPGVHIIANAQNRRFAHANNQGIEFALQHGADYILLLNNDTEVAGDFLEHLLQRAETEAQIGMVGPKIYYKQPPDRIWFAGGGISLWRGKIWHFGLRKIDHGQWDTARDVDYLTGCCLLASRACVERIGLLDTGYFMYAEDADWCLRARQAGFRIVYEPTARVWHKISSSSGGQQVAEGLTAFKAYHKVRSTLRFFRRWARWYHWLTIPFGMALEFAAVSLRLILVRNGRAFLAMLRALLGRSQMPQSGA